jgi:hypothetical protein
MYFLNLTVLQKVLKRLDTVIPACLPAGRHGPESFFFNALQKQPIPDKPE